MTNTNNNKVAIITGGSGGIGREIAKQLAACGIRVVISYLNNCGAANAIVQDIKNDGYEASSFRANVSLAKDIEHLFQFTKERYGRVDIVLNNAGAIIPRNIADTSDAMYQEVFNVNTFGAFLVMRACTNYIEDGGRIINISSTMAEMPIAGSATYAASKAAMEVMGKVLAKEFGNRGITVNNMRLGPVIPGMFAKAPPERQMALTQASPFKRLGTPDDIAKVVSFLVSADSGWISGKTITVDGGIL